MAYVYLVFCSDESIYTGIAHDLNKRISQHKTKTGAKWTKSHGFQYYTYFEVSTFGEAMKKEKEIKKFSRAAKLKLFEKFGIFY